LQELAEAQQLDYRGDVRLVLREVYWPNGNQNSCLKYLPKMVENLQQVSQEFRKNAKGTTQWVVPFERQ
jgi:hypothetical protein